MSFFIIAKVLRNLPFPRYDIREYEGEEIIGRFFEDELVKYIPSDTYPIEVLKKRETKKVKNILFTILVGLIHMMNGNLQQI